MCLMKIEVFMQAEISTTCFLGFTCPDVPYFIKHEKISKLHHHYRTRNLNSHQLSRRKESEIQETKQNETTKINPEEKNKDHV